MRVVVLSTLPSVVVIKAFVAKMLTTRQVIPARCVSIFSTPEEGQSGPSKQSVSDKRVTELWSGSYYTERHATFQMRLQNKLGMWQSIQPSHTFCTFSRTGRPPPLCLWLFSCSTGEEFGKWCHWVHLHIESRFKMVMHRSIKLDQYQVSLKMFGSHTLSSIPILLVLQWRTSMYCVISKEAN